MKRRMLCLLLVLLCGLAPCLAEDGLVFVETDSEAVFPPEELEFLKGVYAAGERKIASYESDTVKYLIESFNMEGTKCILLVNKTDLTSEVKEEEVKSLFTSQGSECPPLLFCSLQTGEGMKELGEYVSDLFHTGEIAEKNEIFLTNLRHKDAVKEALDSICLVKDSIENGMSEDFFSIDLMNAYRVLGTILGEAVEDDLVEEIFSKFCLGK